VKKLLTFIFLPAVLSMACSSAGVASQANANNANTATAPAPAAETVDQGAAASGATPTAPDALVADLYKQHDAHKSPFFQAKNRALVDKYFTKATADLIWKDATRKNQNEVGALDGDPLYNAQDTDIKNFKVGAANVADIKSDKATVIVTFDNFGQKQTLKFLLVQEKGAWKINDIDYGEAGTLVKWLRDEYSGKAEGPPDNRFEGKYQVGDTTCTVKAIKMAFEVRWAKGSGVETFYANDDESNPSFSSEDKDGGFENTFAFDDGTYNTGKFLRADGKELPIKRLK
jgi:hypothetical protein